MAKTKSEKVLNVIVLTITALVLFVAVLTISSIGKGYTNFFGGTMMAVQTDSMKGEGKDNFQRGDLIFVDLVTLEEAEKLKVGQVITFWDFINGQKQLNTHRIIEVVDYGEDSGIKVHYVTKGDANAGADSGEVPYDEIIGVYTGKVPVVGHVVLFIQSTWGFFALIVVPSLLAVGYCAWRLVKDVKAVNKEVNAEKEVQLREKLKAELTKELLGQAAQDSQNADAQKQKEDDSQGKE